MGLLIGEMWDLDALAEDCADDGVYEFWLTAAPLPITGAVGSPVNPDRRQVARAARSALGRRTRPSPDSDGASGPSLAPSPARFPSRRQLHPGRPKPCGPTPGGIPDMADSFTLPRLRLGATPSSWSSAAAPPATP